MFAIATNHSSKWTSSKTLPGSSGSTAVLLSFTKTSANGYKIQLCVHYDDKKLYIRVYTTAWADWLPLNQ